MDILDKTNFKATIKLCKTEEDYPINAAGTIRLWIEGNPPIRTDLRIFIGAYVVDVKEQIKSKDTIKLNDEIKKILDYSQVDLTMYGRDKNRSFSMDIHVPKELIDGYTG